MLAPAAIPIIQKRARVHWSCVAWQSYYLLLALAFWVFGGGGFNVHGLQVGRRSRSPDERRKSAGTSRGSLA